MNKKTLRRKAIKYQNAQQPRKVSLAEAMRAVQKEGQA